MDKQHDSKVQFFNSESSFDSHSVVEGSRLQFFKDQVIADTQVIFNTLHTILLPREDLIQKEKLVQLIHLARIFSKQTIPSYASHFPVTSSKMSENNQIVSKCDARVKELIEDYEKYEQKKMDYRPFYEKYTKANKNFYKRQASNQIFVLYEPDVVKIQNTPKHPLKTLKASGRFLNPQQQIPNFKKQRHYQQLSEQLSELRKNEANLINKHTEQKQKMQRQANNRVKTMLFLAHSNLAENQKLCILQKQLEYCQQQVEELAYRNQLSTRKANQMIEQNERLLTKCGRLQTEAENMRRLAESRAQQQQLLQRSIHSEYGENNSSSKDNLNRLEKKLKNLKCENDLLRSQLKKQREQVYKYKRQQQFLENNQIVDLKKKLENKSLELKQNRLECDRYQFEIIRLTDQLQKSVKSVELVKLEATRTQQSYNPSGSGPFNRTNPDMNRLQQSRSNNKYSIQMYNGDGNQYYPYFQLLSKQYKIRFKRSILKQKQLLYKLNMLEVGIITQFQQPNQIKMLLHLSNFSDHEDIKNLSIKVSNAKNNKIVLEKNFYQKLEIQQQVKLYVNVFVKVYPIGCTALIIQYEYMGARQEARILLPAHIFKMFRIKPRDDEFRQSKKTLSVVGQKKIIKDSETFASYFKGAHHDHNKIKSTIFHEHSETKFLLDIENRNGQLFLEYEHRMGDENITEYAIKTIVFSLRKQQHI